MIGFVVMSSFEFHQILSRNVINLNNSLNTEEFSYKDKSKFVVITSVILFLLFTLLLPPFRYYAITVWVCGFFAWYLFGFYHRNYTISTIQLANHLLTVCYVVLPWCFVWKIYVFDQGPSWVLYLIAVVMGSDTGGYFAGKYFGRNQLAKVISPKKTWEGAVGAVICAYVFSGLVMYLYGLFNIYWWLVITFLCSVFSMTGDLIESAFKRAAKVKDSGDFFPGHGGFLDRADGFLLAAPFLWVVISLLFG